LGIATHFDLSWECYETSMIKTAIATLVSSFALIACTSQEPTVEPNLNPIEADVPLPSKDIGISNPKPCPEIRDFSAYRNLMPGPGSRESRKRVLISFAAIDGEGWAMSEKTVDRADTIRISLFRTNSQLVKPPARSLEPIKRFPGREASNIRVARFTVVKDGANRIELYCDGEMVTDASISAVH
jgi:hypothetical protein